MTIPIIPNGLGSALDAGADAVASIIQQRRARDLEVRQQAGEGLGKIDELVKLGILPHDVYRRPDVQQMMSAALSITRGPKIAAGGLPIDRNAEEILNDVKKQQAANIAANPESEAAHAATGIASPRKAEVGVALPEAQAKEHEATAFYHTTIAQETADQREARAALLSAQTGLAQVQLVKARNDVAANEAVTKKANEMLADPKSDFGRLAAYAQMGLLPYLSAKMSKDVSFANRDEQRIFQLGQGAIQAGAIDYNRRHTEWENNVRMFDFEHSNWEKNDKLKQQRADLFKNEPDLNQITSEHMATVFKAANLDPETGLNTMKKSMGVALGKNFPIEKEKKLENTADDILNNWQAKGYSSQREAIGAVEAKIKDPLELQMLHALLQRKMNKMSSGNAGATK